MSYFFDLEYDSPKLGRVQQRGRVYRVVDRAGDTRWYEISQVTTVNGEKMAEAAFPVWPENLADTDITEDEIARALVRRYRG
jgi:hypothetical protein